MVLSPAAPELGFGFKSIKRGIKKAGKVTKKVGKVAVKASVAPITYGVKANVALAKMGAKLALLPLKYLIKAARTIGVTLCNAPPPLLEQAAIQANVDPAFIPLFCTAVRENKFSLGSLRRLLPPGLKVAGKLAATGAFPPIVPVLAVVKRMPYVGRFADAEQGFPTPLMRNAVRAMSVVALADYAGALDDEDAAAMGLGPAERQDLQGILAGQIGAVEASDRNAVVLGGVTLGFTLLGFYLLFR